MVSRELYKIKNQNISNRVLAMYMYQLCLYRIGGQIISYIIHNYSTGCAPSNIFILYNSQ